MAISVTECDEAGFFCMLDKEVCMPKSEKKTVNKWYEAKAKEKEKRTAFFMSSKLYSHFEAR